MYKRHVLGHYCLGLIEIISKYENIQSPPTTKPVIKSFPKKRWFLTLANFNTKLSTTNMLIYLN